MLTPQWTMTVLMALVTAAVVFSRPGLLLILATLSAWFLVMWFFNRA